MNVLSIRHVVQPAVLVDDMNAAIDWLARTFLAYPSERVDIANAGVNNAVYAFSNQTYLELIEPYNPESSAYRLLRRNGPGWHMLSADLAPVDVDEVDTAIRATGVRVVQHNHTQFVAGAWHLHPRDTGGVLLNLAIPAKPDEHGMWAGWAWRQYVSTNTRVVDRILGVSMVTDDLVRARAVYSSLGFDFVDGESDNTIVSRTASGTFLSLTSPRLDSTPAGRALARYGPGLYRLYWGVKDLDRVRKALTEAGTSFEDEGTRLSTGAEGAVLAVPMTFCKLEK